VPGQVVFPLNKPTALADTVDGSGPTWPRGRWRKLMQCMPCHYADCCHLRRLNLRRCASSLSGAQHATSMKPIGYSLSYLTCRAGQLDPIWQPCTEPNFRQCTEAAHRTSRRPSGSRQSQRRAQRTGPSKRLSWISIVASAPLATLPHGRASSSLLASG
jgi:hypothetical protein